MTKVTSNPKLTVGQLLRDNENNIYEVKNRNKSAVIRPHIAESYVATLRTSSGVMPRMVAVYVTEHGAIESPFADLHELTEAERFEAMLRITCEQ